MPKAKPIASISGLIDTDMEDDTLNVEADAFPTPDSNQENGAGKKKGKGKPSTKRFTKPKTRRSGDNIAKAPKPGVGTRKAPLKEQRNQQQAEETEEVDEFEAQDNDENAMDELVDPKPTAKRKAPQKKAGRPPKKPAVEQVNPTQKDGEFEFTPTTNRQTKVTNNKPVGRPKESGSNKRQQSKERQEQDKVISETQVPMDAEPSDLPENDPDDDDAVPQSVFRRTNNARNNTQPQPLVRKGRTGNASDTERAGNDPNMRRKLGEMTKKLESLELKYNNLKEVGSVEAKAKFQELEASTQARAKASHELINSLKKQLATQKELSQDSLSLQKQIVSRDADLNKTQALADQLSTSLSEAQNEIKALQAKLANSRSASTAVESLNTRTPGGGMGGKTPAARTVMVGSAEAAKAAQIAQLKEDLYSDLTGLILRGVERSYESDVYDCLQTGPNGTLHFKLGIAKDTEGSYNNTEFQYTPRLDSNRDRDLIALLPEYLTDDITFSRTNAAMFYGRVVNCLTKKRLVEGQE